MINRSCTITCSIVFVAINFTMCSIIIPTATCTSTPGALYWFYMQDLWLSVPVMTVYTRQELGFHACRKCVG